MVLEKDFGLTRDALMTKLKEKGIDTRPFFYPMSQMPMYNDGRKRKVTYEIYQQGINLPSGVNLEKKQIEWLTKEIINILGNG